MLRGVALVVGTVSDPATKVVVASTGRQIVCAKCDVKIKPRSPLQPSVTAFRGEGIGGRLQVSLREYDLKTQGEVYLGKGELRMEQAEGTVVRITGRTAPVV